MPFAWHYEGGQDRPNRIFEYPLALTMSILSCVSPDLAESVTRLDEAGRSYDGCRAAGVNENPPPPGPRRAARHQISYQ